MSFIIIKEFKWNPPLKSHSFLLRKRSKFLRRKREGVLLSPNNLPLGGVLTQKAWPWQTSGTVNTN